MGKGQRVSILPEKVVRVAGMLGRRRNRRLGGDWLELGFEVSAPIGELAGTDE